MHEIFSICISLVCCGLWENTGTTKADVIERSGHSNSLLEFASAVMHEARLRNSETVKHRNSGPSPYSCSRRPSQRDEPVTFHPGSSWWPCHWGKCISTLSCPEPRGNIFEIFSPSQFHRGPLMAQELPAFIEMEDGGL